MRFTALQKFKYLPFILIILILFLLFYWHLSSEKKTSKTTSQAGQIIHFATKNPWKNDPQKPIYFDGAFHYYYLYNSDFPTGNGTAWRHTTTTDFSKWTDHGIAIPKYTNKNKDIWTGSVVQDKNNTMHKGKNVIFAVVTQPGADGQQAQFLWYSTNKGKSFKPYSEKAVLANPGTKDFRDPRVIWDSARRKWVMLLAEGNRIGFYESSTLDQWSYVGDFQTDGLGTLETPDLFQIKASDGTSHWVLAASANGLESGQKNTYAYWVGTYHLGQFTTKQTEPLWLDQGFDWYAGVSFAKNEGSSTRYALAWLNNWKYATSAQISAHKNGMDSLTRSLTLAQDDTKQYRLYSEALVNAADYQTVTKTFQSTSAAEAYVKQHPQLAKSYKLSFTLHSPSGNSGVAVKKAATKEVTVGIEKTNDGATFYTNRSKGYSPTTDSAYDESQSTLNQQEASKNSQMTIYVDQNSVESYLNHGKYVQSNFVTTSNDTGLHFYKGSKETAFDNIQITFYQKK